MTDAALLTTASDDDLLDELTSLAAQIAHQTCRFLVLIAELERRGVHAQWGMKTMAELVSYRCSVAPATAREYVRVAHALGSLPSTTAAFSRGELSYSKVRTITRVATPEREAELVEFARTATAAQLVKTVQAVVAATRTPTDHENLRRVTTRTNSDAMGELHAHLSADELALVEAALRQAVTDLPVDNASADALSTGSRRADALVRICESYLATGDASRSGPERNGVVVHVDLAADGSLSAPTIDGTPVAVETAERIACDCTRFTIVGGALEPIGSGHTTRIPNRAMRRAIARRSGGRCEWPGCDRRAYLELHHIVHWTRNGPTEWWNLVALCWHHHNLVHEGRWRITLDRGTGRITAHRPDGTPVEPPSAPVIVPTEPAALEPDAIVPLWRGERFDLEACGDAVLSFTGRRAS